MIINRTPFRISFFGGGTDYPVWYQQHGGMVLVATMNHYCYLTCRRIPRFFGYKYRISWSHIEEVCAVGEIQHMPVKAILDWMQINQGVEIHHQSDLPIRSGVGSSSALVVGLIQAMNRLQNKILDKHTLASSAIHIEQNVLSECVGVQDQIATAFGGVNQVNIQTNGTFQVIPVILSPERLQTLQDHLVLFFTGVTRSASEIARQQMQAIASKIHVLNKMMSMVLDAIKILTSDADIAQFGYLLHESWMLKQQISNRIAPEFIQSIYARALANGAMGGKLLGAGGGGFMLFFVKPQDKARLCLALQDLVWVPFEFESQGAQIIFHDHQHQRAVHAELRS
jgi:D-glycero-alpha-D-manno-heptose-7-phosphate kinase